MMSDKDKAYHAAAHLMEQSELYQMMTDEDIERCIVTPVERGLFLAGYTAEEVPYLFATYAFPEQHHIDEYYSTGDFPIGGYYGDGHVPFIVDYLCMTGMRDIKSSLIYIKGMFDRMGYTEYRSFRVDKQKKGWVSWKGKDYGRL